MRATPTEVVITASVLDSLRHHACEQPEREVCGVLLGTWGSPVVVDSVVPGTNMLDASDRYILDAATLLAADDIAAARNASVIGFYHSHPNHHPIPSVADRTTAWQGFVYLIVSVWPDHATATCAWSIDAQLRVHPLQLVASSIPA